MIYVNSVTLAREACHIEIERLGKPIGRQDQYIAAYGNMRFIAFNEEGIVAEKMELPRDEKQRFQRNLMLFDTGQRRESEEILSSQKKTMDESLDKYRYLKRLAHEGRDSLLQHKFDDIGELL